MKLHRWAFLPLAALLGVGCADDIGSSGDGTVTEAETSDLQFTREEEKLARDVYTVLGGMEAPFTNVQQSEQNHMDAVASLLVRYGVTDPVGANGPGEFVNEDIRALYEPLVAQGMRSVEDALVVGCAIEELDLRDVEAAKARATQADLVAMYDNLLRGSRNHLRAFYGALSGAGGAYAPKYIEQSAFDQFVTSAPERGRGF